MNKSLIAYDLNELEKVQILAETKTLYKSKVIDQAQYNRILEESKSKLYTPTLFIKILLFILSYIGMTTVIGPIGLIFSVVGETGYRIVSVLLGFAFIWFTEKIVIQGKNHYKSGVTEAGIYAGCAFMSFGIWGFGDQVVILYLITGLIFSAIITVRYLDFPALISGFVFLISILYKIIHAIGGLAEALMPFIFLLVFLFIFLVCILIDRKLSTFVFSSHLIIAKTLSLLIVYASVNYFVVRELSVKLMGMILDKGQDIPYAIVFYGFTALLPVFYIYYGIVKRSVLFIRVGLIITVLSVITFKYYFSMGLPVVTFTVAGLILISVSLWLMNYLKIMRNGFTRDNLINDKWLSEDVNAIIISQTLGGNKLADVKNQSFGGGTSGGGGATSNW